jgi:hypothetical protein
MHARGRPGAAVCPCTRLSPTAFTAPPPRACPCLPPSTCPLLPLLPGPLPSPPARPSAGVRDTAAKLVAQQTYVPPPHLRAYLSPARSTAAAAPEALAAAGRPAGSAASVSIFTPRTRGECTARVARLAGGLSCRWDADRMRWGLQRDRSCWRKGCTAGAVPARATRARHALNDCTAAGRSSAQPRRSPRSPAAPPAAALLRARVSGTPPSPPVRAAHRGCSLALRFRGPPSV